MILSIKILTVIEFLWSVFDLKVRIATAITIASIVIAQITHSEIHSYELYGIIATAAGTFILTLMNIWEKWKSRKHNKKLKELDIQIKKEQLKKLQTENGHPNEIES